MFLKFSKKKKNRELIKKFLKIVQEIRETFEEIVTKIVRKMD